jgi:hypothetical protein
MHQPQGRAHCPSQLGALASLQCLADIQGNLVASKGKTRPRSWVGHRLGRDDRVGFRVFAWGETLDAWGLTDGNMGRLHTSPGQGLVAILGVATPLAFAITECLTADTATRRGQVASRGAAPDIPRFAQDGACQDLPKATHGENWLRVFGDAGAVRMGQGVGQQLHTRAVRSEKWWDSVAV